MEPQGPRARRRLLLGFVILLLLAFLLGPVSAAKAKAKGKQQAQKKVIGGLVD